MKLLLITASILVVATGIAIWLRRRETGRKLEMVRASARIEDCDDILVHVARRFWFPASGTYGAARDEAIYMLEAFIDALPEGATPTRHLVAGMKTSIDEDGSFQDREAVALRALFEAISDHDSFDESLYGAASIAPAVGSTSSDDLELSAGEREELDRLRTAVEQGQAVRVVDIVDERLDSGDLQDVFRAGLLDCRGRAYLSLDQPQRAVSDFERAAKLNE